MRSPGRFGVRVGGKQTSFTGETDSQASKTRPPKVVGACSIKPLKDGSSEKSKGPTQLSPVQTMI